jgi:hypothetical protein
MRRLFRMWYAFEELCGDDGTKEDMMDAARAYADRMHAND